MWAWPDGSSPAGARRPSKSASCPRSSRASSGWPSPIPRRAAVTTLRTVGAAPNRPAALRATARLPSPLPGAASRYDLRHVGARAKRTSGGFILEAEKRAVLHAASADTLIVSARTSGGDTDATGISLFLVDRGAAGLTVREYRTIDELRGAGPC